MSSLTELRLRRLPNPSAKSLKLTGTKPVGFAGVYPLPAPGKNRAFSAPIIWLISAVVSSAVGGCVGGAPKRSKDVAARTTSLVSSTWRDEPASWPEVLVHGQSRCCGDGDGR